MNILFRADSSSLIGTGHIMRDLVLAQQLEKKYPHTNITFAVQNLSGNINHKIKEKKYKIQILQSNSKKELTQLIKELKIDLLIIDHYEIDAKKERYIKEKTDVKILSFDDTYEKHHCDILLNHNINAEKKKYKGLVPKECEVRCGSKYTLLRDEFYKEKKKKYKKKSKNTRVFVAIGGADHSNINIKILKVLKKFDNIKVELVTTTANKHLSELKKYCKNKKWISLHINSNKIAKLMRKSDFAIVTPSVTVNEVYFMQLPFIAIKTATNQDEIYKYLKRNRFTMLDVFNVINVEKEIVLMINKLKSQLINFTQLSLGEKMMVLEWRNNESVKKWMYNRNDITLENHLQYIDSLSDKNDRIYFLVKNETAYLGVVDLTEIKSKKSAELGIYANPKLRGYGSLLMSRIVEYAFQRLGIKILYANVYEKNTKAIKLYKKFGFKTVGTLEDNNGKLQKMELKNENR